MPICAIVFLILEVSNKFDPDVIEKHVEKSLWNVANRRSNLIGHHDSQPESDATDKLLANHSPVRIEQTPEPEESQFTEDFTKFNRKTKLKKLTKRKQRERFTGSISGKDSQN